MCRAVCVRGLAGGPLLYFEIRQRKVRRVGLLPRRHEAARCWSIVHKEVALYLDLGARHDNEKSLAEI